MPGIGHLTVADHAVMQRGSAMRTNIVDGEKAFLAVKEADLNISKHDAATRANRELLQL